MLTIEPDGEADHGPRPGCGYISNDDIARATYFIRFTDGHLDHGALLLVSIGRWGTEAGPTDRVAFGLELRMLDNGPAFMLVDAADLPWGHDEFLGAKLTREAALAHPHKAEVFQMMDRLIEDDPRFHAFLCEHA